ncbi:MAG: transposase, partial [Hyphomicrobium sp.]|nr:transposase [Hyphomicrobium sp.]
MAQIGFFDSDRRLELLSKKGDRLEAIDKLVCWESFRADIEAVVMTPDDTKKSNAGRKPIDAIVLFRMLVVQTLYNLSDEETEFQINDSMTFMRFIGKGLEGRIPDATTLWLFREKLASAGLIEKLLERFDQHLE